MIVLYLILGLAALAINFVIATEFCAIAMVKGHPERKYFHYCFWLGIIGYLLVIALPNQRNPRENPDLPEL